MSSRHRNSLTDADLAFLTSGLTGVLWIAILLAWSGWLSITCALAILVSPILSAIAKKADSWPPVGVFSYAASRFFFVVILCVLVLLLSVLGLPILLLLLAFPKLLWFAGALMVVSSALPWIGKALRPLQPRLFVTAVAGTSLAFLFHSVLPPLAATVVFAALWGTSWRRLSRRDLWAHAARLWRPPGSSLGSTAESETPQQVVVRQLATIPRAARKAFVPDEGEAELSRLLVARAEGGWAGLTLRYFSLACDLHRAFAVEDTARFAARYFELWRDSLIRLDDTQLYNLLERLSGLEGPADLVKGDPSVFLYCDLLFRDAAVRRNEPRPEPSLSFALSGWIACHLQGRTAEDPESLREILRRPAAEALLPLCRRILGHAVQFQEGAFVRELAQNVLDEALRVSAGPERRIVDISCRMTEEDYLEVEVSDRLGMSFATLVNVLLIPNRTTKSPCDWQTIGRFGQGFFTVLRDAEEVLIQTCLQESEGTRREFHVRLAPVWSNGVIHDVVVDFAETERGRDHSEGTTITWRGHDSGGAEAVAHARMAIRDQLQALPVEDLAVRLEGELINQPYSNFASVPTLLGTLSLSAGPAEDQDLLVTKNGLPLARVSRHAGASFLPGAPEKLMRILFTGGVVLDLPPGLPLNRTRTALAAKERFAAGLTHETVRACLLADIEAYLRLKPIPSTMVRDDAIPTSYYHDSHQPKRRRRRAFRRDGCDATVESLAENIAAGKPFLEELNGWWVYGADLLVSLPCINHRLRSRRNSVHGLARSSFLGLLLHDLPYPSWPVRERGVRKEGLGLTGTLVRWMTDGPLKLIGPVAVLILILFLCLPFRFFGQQVSWIALLGFTATATLWAAAKFVTKSRFAVAVTMTEDDEEGRLVWEAFGSIGARLVHALIGVEPICRLYRRNTRIEAFARGRLEVFWNAWYMKRTWDIRHLLRFLLARGGEENAVTLEPWLKDFLLLLTHESQHLQEKSGCTTHDEAFYQQQRRLLEKVLRQEESCVEIFDRMAQRNVSWTCSPAWAFIARRMTKRGAWEVLTKR